jgi:thermitase
LEVFMIRQVPILTALTALFFSACFAQVPTYRVLGPSIREVVPGELLVKFREGTTRYELARFQQRFGGVVTPSKAGMGVMKLRVPAYRNVIALARWLRTDPAVEFAEPNGIVHIAYPDDEYYYLQWALPKIDWPAAMDLYKGRPSVIIAIVDTGVQLDHPDLADKLLPGWDFVNDDDQPDDDNHHGTHVAGTAAAITDNAIGVAGVAPEAMILPVKCLNAGGGGTWENVAAGINHAANNGAHVLNLSFGGTSGSTVALNALKAAASQGCIIAAAAGNLNNGNPFYPAFYGQCIAVAASTPDDTKLSMSNYNAGVEWVDVAAPGDTIYSTWVGSTYRNDTGTSMASPHVAGEAAVLYALVTEPDAGAPRSPAAQAKVRQLIEGNVVDVGSWVTYGRIDMGAAVAAGFAAVVSGNVGLHGHVAPETVPVLIEVYEQGTGTLVESQLASLEPSGDYTAIFESVGTYDLRFTAGPPFLARRVADIDLSRITPASDVDTILPNGDVNGDEVVDVVDINELLLAFGDPGGPADVNGDGMANLADLTLILVSFGKTSDA